MSYYEIYRGQSDMISKMKATLAQEGPVPFGIYANNSFMSYSSGIFQADCSTGANHEVAAIGYGTNYIHGTNSWGGGWGESGNSSF